MEHPDMPSSTVPSEPVRLRWRSLSIGIAILVALTGALLGPGRVAAHDSDRPRPCGLRTLRGDFGLLASGTRLVPFGPNAGKTEQVLGTGLRHYDGAGGFRESGADLHGQLT